MSVLPILRWPDRRLTQICAPVGDVAGIGALMSDMFDTMYAAGGRGLAAPQVGVLARVFVLDAGWKDGAPDPQVFINPEIVAVSDESATIEEGCLSIPGVLAEVTRPARVTVRYLGGDGGQVIREVDGFEAVAVQHELDHLDGVVTFDRLEPAARAAMLGDYGALA